MKQVIDIIVGARPNFIKAASIIKELDRQMQVHTHISYRLVHTMQHYDEKMSEVFFEELNIPTPEIQFNLNAASTSNIISAIIEQYTKVLEQKKTKMVLVLGDVNSTLACAIACKKMDPNIILVHVEAGLRCDDKTMPEELNRRMTDSISDFYFTTSLNASQNLYKEGISKDRVFFVGNTMIDTLYSNLDKLIKPLIWDIFNLRYKDYFVLTIHRQANIQTEKNLRLILEQVQASAQNIPIVFPIHPHTAQKIKEYEIVLNSNFIVVEPLGYLEFNFLVQNARAVITDSGGISEETTILNVPCLTLRNNTERPETCTIGTNKLVGLNAQKIKMAFEELEYGHWPSGRHPELWDGKAAMRIVDKVINICSDNTISAFSETSLAANQLTSLFFSN